MNDDDLKKIQKLIKDEIRPVKEIVEVLQSKMTQQDFVQKGTASSVRSIKEQQSVMNEKLDSHSGSLVNIELKLDAYGDMYKINKHNIERLDTRTTKLEKHLNIEAPEEQKVPHFSAD
jgi:hypothetical protein